MDENEFQSGIRGTEWFREFVKEHGEEPDLDTKDYDYRKAWSAGLRPERYEPDGGRYHWPSSAPDGSMLKSEEHPTAWMEHFMRLTGRDPNEIGFRKENFRNGRIVFDAREPSESELEYFKNAPHVGGMMSEDPDDDRYVLNPHSPLSDEEKQAVAANESARIWMRKAGAPQFELTGPQREFLDTTDYKDAPDEARRATIAARILSNDSSAHTPTDEQKEYVGQLRKMFYGDDR